MGLSWRLDARGRFHVTICRSLHEGRARRKRPGERNLSEKPGNRRFKRSQCSGTGKEKILRNGGALRLVAACRPNPDQGRRFSVLKFSTCVGAAGSGAPMIRRAPSDRKSRSERRARHSGSNRILNGWPEQAKARRHRLVGDPSAVTVQTCPQMGILRYGREALARDREAEWQRRVVQRLA